ncbi:zinc-finger homeodomain protein 1-like [Salvia splendens]|uniref:zinc-finger homeodomain protein 1-like n=1 Tax=Salvia splendens TaxID=180675 RepID=UPI001C251DE8|nr:zinc-finger homeodomain protein 1-like [Salvia splendens]
MEYEEEQEGEIPSYDESTRAASPPSAAPPPLRKSRYKECLKNHAVGIGGHAVDGCGEFIADGEDGSLESLRCAACSCHRNFHRKEVADGSAGGAAFFPFQHHQHQHHHQLVLAHHGHFGYRAAETGGGYLHVPQQKAALLALPSSSGGGGSREEADEYNYYSGPGGGGGGSQKKRFRTKFSQEQKERMLSFAERLGWKIQKQDEEIVQHFCDELGIKRHVLKVWMHNNKHTLGKKT